jgi:hypothetical protein
LLHAHPGEAGFAWKNGRIGCLLTDSVGNVPGTGQTIILSRVNPAGLDFFRDSTPRPAQFTPQMPQYAPNSFRFNFFALKFDCRKLAVNLRANLAAWFCLVLWPYKI